MTSNEMNALDTQYSQFACPGPFCWAFQYRFFNFLWVFFLWENQVVCLISLLKAKNVNQIKNLFLYPVFDKSSAQLYHFFFAM